MLAAGPLTRHTMHIPLIVAYNLTLAFVLACATADPPRLLAAWRTWRVACCMCNRAALCVVSACRYAASCSDLVSCVGQIRTGCTLRRLLPLPTSCAILPSSGSRLRQPPLALHPHVPPSTERDACVRPHLSMRAPCDAHIMCACARVMAPHLCADMRIGAGLPTFARCRFRVRLGLHISQSTRHGRPSLLQRSSTRRRLTSESPRSSRRRR